MIRSWLTSRPGRSTAISRIFLIEDNAADVELFRLALGESCPPCEVVVFEDGSAIIDHVRAFDPALSPPDLIVMDLNLPKRSGLEVLQVIREAGAFDNIPIAVLSSSSSARERVKLEAFNIRQFIVKPPDLEQYLKIGEIVLRLLDEKEGAARTAATSTTKPS